MGQRVPLKVVLVDGLENFIIKKVVSKVKSFEENKRIIGGYLKSCNNPIKIMSMKMRRDACVSTTSAHFLQT